MGEELTEREVFFMDVTYFAQETNFRGAAVKSHKSLH